MDRRVESNRTGAGRVRRASGPRVALLPLALLAGAAAPGAAAQAPDQLAETGLYADFAARAIDPANLPFSPQYPLWTDGAAKRRWIRIPAGTTIDASDPDAWVFPAGTRLWKEFALGGRPVETRYMERLADGSWLYATYQWSADGSEARRAPERGVRRVAESAPGVPYDLPGVWDCRSCHEGSPSRVLGFLDGMVAEDFLSREHLAHLRVESDPHRLLDRLGEESPPPIAKWTHVERF